MSPATLRFIALLLIPMQLWMACMRGHTLCVPTDREGSQECVCVAIEEATPRQGCHAHAHSHGRNHAHCRAGGSGSIDLHAILASSSALPASEPCSCHIHVPVTTDDDSLLNRGAKTTVAIAFFFVPPAIDERVIPTPCARIAPRPPDKTPPPHLAGWTSIRLLI